MPAFLVVAYGTLPVCLGVAVLKYRLYELDRIISRVIHRPASASRRPGHGPQNLISVVDQAFQPTQVAYAYL